MTETSERTVHVGFKKTPKAVFNEIEAVAAAMIRQGWIMKASDFKDDLSTVSLIFEREIPASNFSN